MRIEAGRGRLYDALKQLRRRWEDIEPLWTDSVRRDFEEKVLAPLNVIADDALRAMDRLTQVFNQARRECTSEAGVGDLPS
jgi:hypothetical protein